jgi:hypothetical protein
MKKWIPICLLVLSAGSASAQQAPVSSPWGFRSINTVGLLAAQAGNAFQLQTVNGAQYKSWFLGAGIGLDYYRYRTIPLFLDLRKEFFSGADKLFVYADAGASFAWVSDNQKSGYADEKFSNGFYDDFGLGYKRVIAKHSAFLLSLGYSYKKLTQTYTQYYFHTDGDPGIGPVFQTQKINYAMNRLTIKIGWEF